MLTAAQKLIQIEVHEAAKEAVKESSAHDDAVESEIRVGVLESYLRPALVPNERWSDVQKWQFHSRLLRWARTEFLTAKYGAAIRSALHAFPTLRKSPQLQSAPNRGVVAKLLFDREEDSPTDDAQDVGVTIKLPTSASLIAAFGMQQWKAEKDLSVSRSDMERIATRLGGDLVELRGGAVSFAAIPPESDLSALSLEEILEVAGGHVIQCGPFNAICEDAGIYQFWTREYVSRLGRYLQQRISPEHDTVIIDVGAGDGLLTQLLREYFDKERDMSVVKEPGRSKQTRPQQNKGASASIPTTVATDDGSWRISEKADVEELSVEAALAKYTLNIGDEGGLERKEKQVIVLCSWMPMNEDWSSVFRSNRVDEYILIGECDDGQCGDNWETWGNPNHLVDYDELLDESSDDNSSAENDDTPSTKTEIPFIPYELEGYIRRDLDELAPYQFSRFDCRSSKSGRTVSFRRTGQM